MAKRRVEELNEQKKEYDTSVAHNFDYIQESYLKNEGLEDFYIKDNSIFIDGEDLLMKNDKVLNLDMKSEYTLAEIKWMLSDYGQYVFSLRNKYPFNQAYSTPSGIFTGKINDYPIVILLQASDDGKSLSGRYAYLKQGIGITLNGTIIKDVVELKEEDSKGNITATISTRFNGKYITGKWKSGDKVLDFSVSGL